MSGKTKQNLVDKSSNSVWFLIWGVAAVTFFLKTDFYDPFNSAKLILLLLVGGWIFGHLVNSYKKNTINRKSQEFISTMIILSFIIFLLASTILTEVFIVGLLGDTQRRNGFLAYLGLSIIFLYSARTIRFFNVLRIYKVAILIGLVLSCYGLMQINGKDFIKWSNPYNAMISTLGNPNFASATLAILSLLALYGIFLKDLPVIYKLLGITFIVISLIDIVSSDSRQGLLVIFFSILVYVSIYLYYKNRKIGFLVMFISAFIGALAVAGMLQKGPLTALLYKDSVSVRGYYWRAGIEMFKSDPLTGVGVDRYGAYFKEFREVGYPLKYGYEITSSNAHNTFIQLFATAGIFVGTLYLILIGYILFSGIKLLRKSDREDQKITLGLISAWVGFQAQSLISIDNIGISVWGWLLSGAIIGLSNKLNDDLKETEIQQVSVKKAKNVQINLFQPAISALVLVPVIVFSSFFYKSESDLFFLKGITVPSSPQNKQPVLDYVNKVVNNPLADPFYKYRAAYFLLDMGYTDEAYNIVLSSHKFDPRNPDYLQGLANFEESKQSIQNAISVRNKISHNDPWNADNYLKLLVLYKNSGDLVNANDMKNKILNFAPNTDIAKAAVEALG
jgi:O-antigen ligase